jgi:hypothetical protein
MEEEKKEQKKEKGKGGISRREFLKDAGLVVGGAAVSAAIAVPVMAGQKKFVSPVDHKEFATQAELDAHAADLAEKAKIITVMNPLGTPPPLDGFAMAPRLDTLNGKTVYFVSIQSPMVGQEANWQPPALHVEIAKQLTAKYPTMKAVHKYMKGPTYFTDDPDLWKEIKANGHAMVISRGV